MTKSDRAKDVRAKIVTSASFSQHHRTKAEQQKTEKDKNAALQIIEALLAKGEQDINVHIRKF